jgi:hypothetical protein
MNQVIDENRLAGATVGGVRHFADGNGGHYVADSDGIVYVGPLTEAPAEVQEAFQPEPAPWE